MPRFSLVLTLLAVAVAQSAKEEQDPNSAHRLPTDFDLGSPLGNATAARQSPDLSAGFPIDSSHTAVAPALLESVAQHSHPSHVDWRAGFSEYVDGRAVAAEYIAMTLLVIVGCGTAMTVANQVGAAWILQLAFVFGLATATLAWGIGRHSGGQINCAVTLALWIRGSLGLEQALSNFVAQMLGSVTGAIFLCLIFPKDMDKTQNLACNFIGEGWRLKGVFMGEFAMTFLLVMTVLQSKERATFPGAAALPMGLAVFLAHCLLIPMDGCSINPTRSFGPALIASFSGPNADYFRHHAIFWLAPLSGAAVAAGVHTIFVV